MSGVTEKWMSGGAKSPRYFEVFPSYCLGGWRRVRGAGRAKLAQACERAIPETQIIQQTLDLSWLIVHARELTQGKISYD